MYKKPKNKCITPYCRNDKPPGRNICFKCRHKKYKAKYPERYFYYLLKSNAKRRGHNFELTLKEFQKFCQETDYLNKKGKNKNSASIDRINPNKGYSYNNIQILSLSENTKKKYSDKELPF